MQCANVKECLEQVKDYFGVPKWEHFLFVNVQNSSDYQKILDWFDISGKERISVSEFCEDNDSLPFVEDAIKAARKKDLSVLSGLSQALMLRGEKKLDEVLNDVLFRPTHEHRAVILLLGCENYLKKFFPRDIRLPNRVILVNGERSLLPKIYLSTDDFHLPNAKLVRGIKELLGYLERGGEGAIHLDSAMPPKVFSDSCYQVVKAPSAYEWLEENFHEIRDTTTASFGTEDEWKYLASFNSSCSNFTEVVCQNFGGTTNLSGQLKNVMRARDENKKWLLWLALKVFGDKVNNYLSLVLQNCESSADFVERIYLELANVDANDENFSQLYDERKILLDDLGEKYDLSEKYCKKLRILKKDEIFYLTDRSELEGKEFIKCLAEVEYEYSDEEITRALKQMSGPLASYMEDFNFNSVKWTTDGSAALAPDLTAYFKEYKLQKLTNKIRPDFLEKVEKYAESRPYYSLQSRSNLIPQNLAGEKCKPFFIDALGVEYLGFILARCRDKYHMAAEISVGRCELPSTTEINKGYVEESCSSWGKEIQKINALDDIKHKDKEYDFQKCPYPFHLFKELSVIEDVLEKIHHEMSNGDFEKALIVSDHGASRLAVLHGKECPATIELDESGEKSGRCCRVDKEPNPPIKSAVYEGGYVVMANYERIRGGRRADVEVHGGASLEEVIVPVIVLSKRPEEIILSTNPKNLEFTLKWREDVTLELSFSIALEQPRLVIEGKRYEGKRSGLNCAKFTIPDPKRKTYVARLFDGDKDLNCELTFTVKNAKIASEKKLF